MTDTDRLAAALRTQLHDAIRGWFGCEHKGPQGEWPCEDFYARLMGSPTLNAVVCPDPADHKLAEAVARLAETGKVEPNLYFDNAVYHALAYRIHRGHPADDALERGTAALEDKP